MRGPTMDISRLNTLNKLGKFIEAMLAQEISESRHTRVVFELVIVGQFSLQLGHRIKNCIAIDVHGPKFKGIELFAVQTHYPATI
jgi:hypothetical protein